MTRTRQLGDLGEQWTIVLLKEAGFSSIQDLNAAVRYNHRGGDFLADRKGKRYFITVKARNKFVQRTRRLNGGYNIFPEKVRRAAKEYAAIPSWITIQLDTEKRCYSAYFGTIDSLRNPNAVAVPMSPNAVSGYECLAKERFDQAITPALSNQLVERPEAGTESAADRQSPREPSVQKRSGQGSAHKAHHPSTVGATAPISFEDHVAYVAAPLRPVLRELRNRIVALDQNGGRRITEQVTKQQRVAYSVNRIFAELKVQKKRILVRFFGMRNPDPKNIVTSVPATHRWQHDREIAIQNLELLDYAMPFIEASYHSLLTTMSPR